LAIVITFAPANDVFPANINRIFWDAGKVQGGRQLILGVRGGDKKENSGQINLCLVGYNKTLSYYILKPHFIMPIQ
jgi:hypothetical protein